MIRTLVSAGVAAAAAYSVAGLVDRALRAKGGSRFDRTNHAGRTVSLSEGPAVVAALSVGSLFLDDPCRRLGTLSVTAVSGALGAVDDFCESGDAKGLRGHLSALAHGEVTTGALKVIGIPVAAVAVAALARPVTPLAGSRVLGHVVDSVLAGGVVAGTANLFNLLDLRPGRALKAAGVYAALTPTGSDACVLSATVAGTILAAGPADLAGETMLGDTGANALGAALGARSAFVAPRASLLVHLGVLAAATLASEKVSFTKVIESTPGLAEFDAWGRPVSVPRPPAAAVTTEPAGPGD